MFMDHSINLLIVVCFINVLYPYDFYSDTCKAVWDGRLFSWSNYSLLCSVLYPGPECQCESGQCGESDSHFPWGDSSQDLTALIWHFAWWPTHCSPILHTTTIDTQYLNLWRIPYSHTRSHSELNAPSAETN